ncbi:hypothetical protein ASF91_09970 [Rhizobium sp. Leaf155]|nr:hypothetical protein ASF91_09970 [Rhizobium sp. Leaf155]
MMSRNRSRLQKQKKRGSSPLQPVVPVSTSVPGTTDDLAALHDRQMTPKTSLPKVQAGEVAFSLFLSAEIFKTEFRITHRVGAARTRGS